MPVKYTVTEKGNPSNPDAEQYFNKQWSFYNDPSIKSITIKKDSIIVNENMAVKKYKYENNNNVITVNNKTILGTIDTKDNTFRLFKNYTSYYIISNKETNETLFSRASDYGKINYDNIFPKLLNAPTNLTDANEFIFWSNLEYVFNITK